MIATKEFHVGAILTITSGKMIWHMREWQGLLDWMVGESLMTHQLPRASDECEPHLRQQFPDLAAVNVPSGLDSWEKCHEFVAGITARLGETRPVYPLPAVDHTSIDPISEIKMIRPDLPIIPVVADGDAR